MNVRIQAPSDRSVDVKVLVNSGAESERPLIAITPEIAETIGLWPTEGAQLVEVEQAVGVSEAYVMPQAVKLILLGDEDEELSEVEAILIVQEGLREPLITDVTIDELGIQVISFKGGLWRHKSDPLGKIRLSAR